MRAPSVKRLLTAFRDLDDEDAKLIRALAKATDDPDRLEELVERVPETESYVRSMYSDPYDSRIWRTTVALHAMNEIMDTHGVEALGPGRSGDYAPPYEYLNTGDTYGTTLIYRLSDDSLNIGDWGTVVEHHPDWD